MADTPPATAKPSPGGTFGFLGKKVFGKVPVWVIAAAAVGGYYWYTHYGPGKKTGQGMQTDPAGNTCTAINPATGYCPGTPEDAAATAAASGADTGGTSGTVDTTGSGATGTSGSGGAGADGGAPAPGDTGTAPPPAAGTTPPPATTGAPPPVVQPVPGTVPAGHEAAHRAHVAHEAHLAEERADKAQAARAHRPAHVRKRRVSR